MKSKFSKTWNKSVQPRKQVKFRANAPNHIKRKFMGSALDKPLREKHKMRNIEVRKGDEVKIMRGQFTGKQGKVGIVDIKNTRIQVDGVQRSKAGGEKLVTWFHPSNVKILSLEMGDARRLKTSKKETPKEESRSADSKTLGSSAHPKLQNTGANTEIKKNKKVTKKANKEKAE